MFNKITKNKSTDADTFNDKDSRTEDDFFKDDEKPIDEDEQPSEAAREDLAEDLKAFADDLQKTGKEKNAAPENDSVLDVTKDFTKNLPKKDKKEEPEKWSMKKQDNDDDGSDWLSNDYEEGELAVDVYQDKDNIYIKSTIAGISVEDIDISLHNDMLTIRGKREQDKEAKGVDYLYQECYWGSFSRSIILPVEVKADKIDAYLRDGILTVVLPKVKAAKSSGSKIKVKEK